ncbi:TolC family protein [Limnospira platensis]|uniref:TolC family protein n=1 Tax=Limnospira platensis TaxID=118562 RepID=UPI0002803E6A|nr:outer membrane efflux protein [Arthrospira platensis C1]UWU49355.1 Outer membrane protein TolC [Arthrospira platensis C1]
MDKNPEPSTMSDRFWWLRFLLIAIATSGLCITLAVSLETPPVTQANASRNTPLLNPPDLPQTSPNPSINLDNHRTEKTRVKLPQIIGNIARFSPFKLENEPSPTEPNLQIISPESSLERDSNQKAIANPQPRQTIAATLPKSAEYRVNNSLYNWLDGIEIPPQFSQSQPLINSPTNEGTPSPEIPQFIPENQDNAVKLTLPDVVFLTLSNNRNIKNQYLERIIQRRDLQVAEDKFAPEFTPNLSIEWQDIRQGGQSLSMTSGLVLGAQMVIKIPTGGELNMGWTGRGERQGSSFNAENRLRQNLELSFRQPLLRDSGIAVNQASIKIARLDEAINILNLKNTLIDQITQVILAYRNLIQAQERVKIQVQSLASSQQQVENTQFLIDVGRLPAIELIPAQRGVKNNEISLLDVKNNLKRQQLALLNILDLEQDIVPVAVQIDLDELEMPELQEIREIALVNRPDYLQAKLEIEKAETALIIAENNRRWQIDLDTGIRHNPSPNIVEDRTELRAGIVFSKELGDRTIEQEFERRRISLIQAQNDLVEERQQIDINVANAVRDVRDNYQKLELAQELTEFRRQELNNEEEKIRLGVGNTSVVDLVRFQDDLVNAQNAELNAKIDYLNSLTELDRILGTTLERWDIIVETETPL